MNYITHIETLKPYNNVKYDHYGIKLKKEEDKANSQMT